MQFVTAAKGMRSFFFFLLLILVSAQVSYAQNGSDLFWSDVNEQAITETGQRDIVPMKYRTLSLAIEDLRNYVESAPIEFSQEAKNNPLIIAFPLPYGGNASFKMWKSPIMEEGLAEKYPEIRTYAGRGIDDPSAYIRFDITPAGFHAMVISPNGTYFIDPYSRASTQFYTVYYSSDFVRTNDDFSCLGAIEHSALSYDPKTFDINGVTSGEILRTYRLACATTGEYTQFFGGTVPQGLAAVVTAVNRITGVYELETAIRLVLIANNDLIIYTNSSTDPFTNNDGFAMLDQNQAAIDAVIGNANYDMGHVFSTGGGGVAYLGVVCETNWKARGVTGSGAPVGDPFYIDYVAHEMGHQFGANHPFNGSTGSCSGGNRNAATAYEPGSGSTIMAYAGICGNQDLQPNSDPYFHFISLEEIIDYTNNSSGNNCPVATATGNTPPSVSTDPGGWTIPISTPFKLTASATDSDNDPVTYCWEQADLGPAGAPNNPSGNAPIFRSWLPTSSPDRFFPRLSNLVNNNTVIGEKLPTYERTMHFKVTARDYNPNGGGVDFATTVVNVSAAAGPFLVISPNTNVVWEGSSVQSVTWDAANTSAAPVNCSNVNILLSVDGGLTYPYTVLLNTPNDGSESVTVPNVSTTSARIMVEAVNNVFFDISNTNFTIDYVVPVELTSFTAQAAREGVTLSWSTASELNNDKFIVERSIDNNLFSEIGYVAGSGTTTDAHTYSFTDSKIASGTYYYRLKQVDYDGTTDYSEPVAVTVAQPIEFALMQNHPNPFNPSTVISFSVPSESRVALRIVNVLGQVVEEVTSGKFAAGSYSFEINASSWASGIYYYMIEAVPDNGAAFTDVKKMILIK